MPKGSTSIHALNADRGLSLPAKPLYFLLNRLNNLFPMRDLDPRMEIRPFLPDPARVAAEVPPTPVSPARVLTNLFWQSLPWEAMARELGGLRVVDLGCGSADYADRLLAWSGGRIERYLGVDAETHPGWKDRGPFSFVRADAAQIDRLLEPDTSLLISSHALEHLERDLDFFERVRDFGKPLLQVHLMPSSACLGLLLLHGIRQYTPRALSKATRLFGEGSYSVLVPLGGPSCVRHHFRHITLPVLMRRPPAAAPEALGRAILEDSSPDPRDPYLYALVIHSGWKTRLF